jgi:hypothetical protein
MKDDESLVLSSNLKGLPVQVVEHRCYAVLVRIFSCYKACPFELITGKAQKILNLLRRHLYGCNPDVKKRAFTALVLPHLEYTSTV